MREIKYRAYFVDNLSMMMRSLPVSSIHLQKHACRTSCGKILSRSDGLILVEYTGLKDKNGTEIYEGDIFNYRDQIVIVEYFEDMFHCKSTKYPNLSPGNYRLNFVARNHEIIGNIHENQELLK